MSSIYGHVKTINLKVNSWHCDGHIDGCFWLSQEIRVMMDRVWKNFLAADHQLQLLAKRGRRGHDRMVVGFTTTYDINAYHH
jgi:hypothetical protein